MDGYGVLEDLRKLGVKSWRMVAKDRESWRNFFGKPRLILGSSADYYDI
jgi:hypothetical protein